MGGCGEQWITAFGTLAKLIGPCLAVMVLLLVALVLMHRDNQARLLALEQLLDSALSKLHGYEERHEPNKG